MCLLEEYGTNKGYHERVMYQSLQSFDHLKEESRWQWVMKKEMRRESETPHNMHSTASSRATNQVTLKNEEKRRPQYLATTASMSAMTLPTRKYVKRESRLPPRMMLRKRTMSSAEASEEEKKISSGPGKSISSSPERVSSEALKQKEEEKRGKEEKKKATPVISSVYHSFLME